MDRCIHFSNGNMLLGHWRLCQCRNNGEANLKPQSIYSFVIDVGTLMCGLPVQVEIPNIQKQRKHLAKLVLDMDSARTR